jgi:hypothetical protein
VRQELGYKEKGGQFTKFGQWYADRVHDTQYRNAPWCDMFLAWAADKAGVTQYVGEFAWTPSHASWFIKQGAWTQQPEPGALVFFDWKGGKSYKGIDHVGVVERVEGKKIHTIEANVDRVWLKRKVRETDKVVGYGVPRMVKAAAEKLDEIRSTERPFVPAPRAESPAGSPLDVLGTPPALLAAMVLMTIVLSLRVTGRHRGTHRRLPWPWNAPTGPRTDGPSPRTRPPSRPTLPDHESLPAPPANTPDVPPFLSKAKTGARKGTAAKGSATKESAAQAGTTKTSATKTSATKTSASKTGTTQTGTATGSVPNTGGSKGSTSKGAAGPKPGATATQPDRAARSRVPAGSGHAATRHSTPTRRKPYDPT